MANFWRKNQPVILISIKFSKSKLSQIYKVAPTQLLSGDGFKTIWLESSQIGSVLMQITIWINFGWSESTRVRNCVRMDDKDEHILTDPNAPLKFPSEQCIKIRYLWNRNMQLVMIKTYLYCSNILKHMFWNLCQNVKTTANKINFIKL